MLYFSSLRDAKDRDKKNHVNYNKIYTSKRDSIKFYKANELDTLFNKLNYNLFYFPQDCGII